MINLFYFVYAIFTIALFINIILTFIPKFKDKANEVYMYVFIPQALMTIINLVFIYPTIQ